MIDSHLAALAASVGWETMRCHMTACRPSVCGVTSPGSTVGITMHASASCASAPPSRPATPTTDAPRSRASCIASTRFTLTRRSMSPPPTENTNRQSSLRSREARSQLAYELSQPSSLMRAGQLRDVVGHGVRLDVAELAEVARGVRRVTGAAAGAAQEQPSAAFARRGDHVDDGLDARVIELAENGQRVAEKLLR